jgi:hypothetical protein
MAIYHSKVLSRSAVVFVICIGSVERVFLLLEIAEMPGADQQTPLTLDAGIAMLT